MGHVVRERKGARPLHLAGCWCWSRPLLTVVQVDLQAPAPVLPRPRRRSWIERVLLAGGLVEEVR